MKFSCDKCNTRYSIADERVRGRVLKIRCKACNHVVTVREPDAPPPEGLEGYGGMDADATRISAAPSADAADDWYVSFDGDQEGPLPLLRAIDRVRLMRPRGKECFCWRAGFFVWLPVEEVPEFAPALKKVGAASGKVPAIRSPSGARDAVRPTPARPAPASRPLLSDLPPVPEPSAPEPLSLGSAPRAAIPSQPTRPEPRLARKLEPLSAPKPAPKPATDSAPKLSPFAAAMKASAPALGAPENDDAAATGIPDSGPVPLPPPPGDELPIGEASGLINLAHLAKATQPTPASQSQSKPVVETFGGVPVVPAASPTAPQPIVVVSGPARGVAGWTKWAALVGGLATVALGVVVVLLLSRKQTVIVVPPAPTLDDGKRVDDKPITIADSQPTGAGPGANDPKRAQKRPPSAARTATAPKPPPGADKDKLSNAQRSLASLYKDGAAEHSVKAAGANESQHASGPSVSQQAIMAVPTQNRRSLTLCYDRVLKHDSSLKSAKIQVQVKVGISGTVTGVSLPDPQYASSEIGQCLAQTIKRWHFPSSDEEYQAQFPIILQQAN